MFVVETLSSLVHDHFNTSISENVFRFQRVMKKFAPMEKRPKGRPRTRWRDDISYFAWPRLDVEPGELSKIAVDREVFRVLLRLVPPRVSTEEKRA